MIKKVVIEDKTLTFTYSSGGTSHIHLTNEQEHHIFDMLLMYQEKIRCSSNHTKNPYEWCALAYVTRFGTVSCEKTKEVCKPYECGFKSP